MERVIIKAPVSAVPNQIRGSGEEGRRSWLVEHSGPYSTNRIDADSNDLKAKRRVEFATLPGFRIKAAKLGRYAKYKLQTGMRSGVALKGRWTIIDSQVAEREVKWLQCS